MLIYICDEHMPFAGYRINVTGEFKLADPIAPAIDSSCIEKWPLCRNSQFQRGKAARIPLDWLWREFRHRAISGL